jgi:hypothetical protein
VAVLVAGVVVDVEVVVDVVEVEVLLGVVVDVAGALVSVVVVWLVEISIVESGGVVTAFAEASWQALDAKATTATPITQIRLAIPLFSPLRTRDRRHHCVGEEAPSRR